MDIKVNASNEIEKYPYTFTNLNKDYPKNIEEIYKNLKKIFIKS